MDGETGADVPPNLWVHIDARLRDMDRKIIQVMNEQSEIINLRANVPADKRDVDACTAELARMLKRWDDLRDRINAVDERVQSVKERVDDSPSLFERLPLANISELSRVTKLPKNWIYREASEGRIPCLWVTKNRPMFNVDAVISCLSDRARKPVDEVNPH